MGDASPTCGATGDQLLVLDFGDDVDIDTYEGLAHHANGSCRPR